MTNTKSFDIVYPDAVAGVPVIETSVSMKSLERFVKDTAGTFDAVRGASSIRAVRPTQIVYDYVAVERD